MLHYFFKNKTKNSSATANLSPQQHAPRNEQVHRMELGVLTNMLPDLVWFVLRAPKNATQTCLATTGHIYRSRRSHRGSYSLFYFFNRSLLPSIPASSSTGVVPVSDAPGSGTVDLGVLRFVRAPYHHKSPT